MPGGWPTMRMDAVSRWMRFVCVCVTLISGVVASAQDPTKEQPKEDYVKSHYTKYEYRIPMRDGKRLFTAVYVPKDQSHTWPILLTRTPYSAKPYGADQYKETPGPTPLFTKAGYIFVIQDVRGRWMSEGDFVNMRPHNPAKKSPNDIDESSDTF